MAAMLKAMILVHTFAAVLVSAKSSSSSSTTEVHSGDSWDFCYNFACSQYLGSDATSSACLFGCRTAAVGTLTSEKDCTMYCEGIQDQPQIRRFTGNLTALEKKFWRSVCVVGCKSAINDFHTSK